MHTIIGQDFCFVFLFFFSHKHLPYILSVVLQFRVGGNNLLNVCKLVFKVSRNEKNDSYFLEENLLSKFSFPVKKGL